MSLNSGLERCGLPLLPLVIFAHDDLRSFQGSVVAMQRNHKNDLR